ncbi:MAG: DegT/DnrJ/EryC1/StrS family aminotransferase [Phycisphaeraceae bacterium]|nr:DegT/DnrJ/EryC1/StrS family aminotransferase [Phycisphaeraceae bacterium]
MATTTSPTVSSADLAVNGGAPVSDTTIPMISVRLAEADIEAATGVLRSGMLAQGRRVAEFEERFAKLSDAAHGAACANGTCALSLAYEALFDAGDEVLVPGWTYVATASMVVARGATPVFCDVDPATYNLDPADAERRITGRTTAIAATHLYGSPADIDAIQALAERRGLRVIYDAAQAHLATHAGRGVGAFGDAVTYSFYPTKNMTTGEGGMVLTNDADLDRAVRLLRSHGETTKYTHEHIGRNYRMSDVEGAIGCSQLDRIESLTARRREIAGSLDAAIGAIDGLLAPVSLAGDAHAYHLYAVRMDPEAFTCDRDTFTKALNAEGVGTAIHYPKPLHDQPCFREFITEKLPVSATLAHTLFCVPVHPDLTDAQVRMIGEALSKVAGAYRA